MTEKLFNWLRNKVHATGYFKETFALAEIVQDGSKSYPVVYDAEGELKSVHELDIDEGIAYFRIKEIGKSQTSDSHSCKDLRITYDVLLVASLLKGGYTTDNAFASIELCETLWDALWSLDAVKHSERPISAMRIGVEPVKTETGLNVLKTEYSGFGNTLNEHYDTSVVKINFKVTVDISYKCFKQETASIFDDTFDNTFE